MYNYAESESTNFGAMEEMAVKYGVKIKRWPTTRSPRSRRPGSR